MRIEKEFQVGRSLDEAARLLAEDDTLTGLFPEAETEIVERSGARKTTRSRYRVLGREGVATFHFTFEADERVRFEKVCDGRVWRELRGALVLAPRRGGTRVRIELEGRTRPLVPELTIRGPMREQIEQMATALKRRLSTRRSAS